MLRRWIPFLLLLLCLCLPCLAMTEPVITDADATSWIVGKNPDAYTPYRMLDGDETTAFQFSLKTTPLGQAYITFSLSQPSDIRTLWIKNGFWCITDGKDQYTRNSRVRAMTVDFLYSGAYDYTDAQQVTLPDDKVRSDWTRIDLGSHQNVVSVRFLIRDIYAGSKYKNDVCISEVRFSGSASTSSSGTLYGTAISNLATRTGPGTEYADGGTYSMKGKSVRVLSRAWDERNEIWWVQCEIPYQGTTRVLWTGYKRFDSQSLPLESIPVESPGSVAIPNAGPGSVNAPGPQSSGNAWQSAYRQFFISGQYQSALHCAAADSSWQTAFAERETAYDSIALCDLDRNGIPELLIETIYGLEQADVFTWNGSSIVHLGTMSDDNFFQEFFVFTDARYPGIYTAMGGPAMSIDCYTIQNGRLVRAHIAATRVDAEGTETVGLQIFRSDQTLYTLLYDKFVQGSDASLPQPWFSRSHLNSDADWSVFFASSPV